MIFYICLLIECVNSAPIREGCTAEKSCSFFFAKPLDKLPKIWYHARARGIIRARKWEIFHFSAILAKAPADLTSAFFFGAPAENRTPDTMIKSHVLYQLSYRGICLHHNILAYQAKFVNPFFKVSRGNVHRRSFDRLCTFPCGYKVRSRILHRRRARFQCAGAGCTWRRVRCGRGRRS